MGLKVESFNTPSCSISASLEQNSYNQIICSKNNSRNKDKLITNVVGHGPTTSLVSLDHLHLYPIAPCLHPQGRRGTTFLKPSLCPVDLIQN